MSADQSPAKFKKPFKALSPVNELPPATVRGESKGGEESKRDSGGAEEAAAAAVTPNSAANNHVSPIARKIATRRGTKIGPATSAKPLEPQSQHMIGKESSRRIPSKEIEDTGALVVAESHRPQEKQTGSPRTVDKSVQTTGAGVPPPPEDEASTSVEIAQHSLSRSVDGGRLRRRSDPLRVLPWLTRVNSSSLAASKEELNKLYKENAALMRRLTEARPNASRSIGEQKVPREYEMYVSNTNKRHKRSISIQIDMPKFKSKKKNQMTTEATILMLIRKLRRVLKVNRSKNPPMSEPFVPAYGGLQTWKLTK